MGEISDLIISGEVCQYCTAELGDAPGYPRSCAGCGGGQADGAHRQPCDHEDILEAARKGGWTHTLHNGGFHLKFKRGRSGIEVWLSGRHRRSWRPVGGSGKASRDIGKLLDVMESPAELAPPKAQHGTSAEQRVRDRNRRTLEPCRSERTDLSLPMRSAEVKPWE